jgi:outer membrane protein TolC
VPELFPGNGARLGSLIKDGKLYLTLHDAIALAIENNLDVEVERDNLVLADTDLVRARGGGSTRGIDFTVQDTENGVGGPGSPLLNADAVSTNPTTPTVTDLTSLNSTTQAQQNLSVNGTVAAYSPGPNLPLFDPSLIVESGYLQRSNTTTLSTTGTAGTTGTGDTGTTQAGTLHFVTANLSYLQGFSTGAQLEATTNNDSAVIYGSTSQRDPFATLSTSTTLTQPLLRGRGRDVNLRYLRIANLNRKTSRLLFEQQVLETIYGTSRLYFDLVSLGENVVVKQEALRAAQKLQSDDSDQVDQGTLAPIELVRANALLSSSQFDLIQAQGLYRQQEVILRNELIRSNSPVFAAQFTEIVPTDRILVPDRLEPMNVAELVQQGLARRPDLAQANLQVKTGEISVKASRNQALPQLNLYGNVATRGVSEQAYEPLGTPPGTGQLTIPQNFALGGLKTSTIYQGGIQLTLPIRNRVAQSDAARDTIQLRQAQARTEKLSDSIREAVENAVIALETAQAAYQAAVTSRSFQEQLLQSERDKLSVGESTNLLVVQNETYLAQARSTEIAARSNWKKAQIDLDHALGNLLERNGIKLEDAIAGSLRQ